MYRGQNSSVPLKILCLWVLASKTLAFKSYEAKQSIYLLSRDGGLRPRPWIFRGLSHATHLREPSRPPARGGRKVPPVEESRKLLEEGITQRTKLGGGGAKWQSFVRKRIRFLRILTRVLDHRTVFNGTILSRSTLRSPEGTNIAPSLCLCEAVVLTLMLVFQTGGKRLSIHSGDSSTALPQKSEVQQRWAATKLLF